MATGIDIGVYEEREESIDISNNGSMTKAFEPKNVAYDIVIVDNTHTTNKVLVEINKYLEEGNRISLDCEGVKLSRRGTLCVLSLATDEKVYLFDVFEMKDALFQGRLKAILEDECIEKLMFDCRQDADCLWHCYNVKLDGVLDMQLLEVMYRRDHPDEIPARSTWRGKQSQKTKKTPSSRRRSQMTEDVESIYGYKKCIEVYLQDKEMLEKKTAVQGADWKPLPLKRLETKYLEYCCVDTQGLFRLFDRLNGQNYLSPLRVASARYIDRYRSLGSRSYDDFELNSYLPLDIIPEMGSLTFPHGIIPCKTCHRKFPREEFSTIQYKRGEQKCRVCKKIKFRKDVEKNREQSWGEDHDDYDSDSYGDCYDSD